MKILFKVSDYVRWEQGAHRMYYFVSLSWRKFCGLASVWRLIVIVIILEGLKISEVEDMKESKIVILRFMLKKKTVM